MMKIEDENCPKVGSRWMHYKGGQYIVTGHANAAAPSERYPLTIIYRGASNCLVWCRPADDWHRSMKFMGDEK